MKWEKKVVSAFLVLALLATTKITYSEVYDEGTSFVTAEKGITTLYREPGYLTTPLPVTTSYTYGNNRLAKPDSSSQGGSETSVFDNLSIAPALVVTPTSPSSYLVKVNSGLNTIDFSTSVNANEWCKLALRYSSYTSSISTSGFKIKFSDGSKLFVKDAIDNGYLTTLTLFTGFYPYSDPNWINFYTSGNLAIRNYPVNLIITKPLIYSITGVEFTSNKNTYWGPNYYDGFYAQKYDSSVQFSLSPIDKPDLQITDISCTPANPVTGDDVSFTATVRNNGTEATPPDTVHNVDFFIDGTKVIWSDNYISSIAPGESVTITANAGINGVTWTVTDGPHGVTAIVNSNQIIDEADTSNNSFVKIINQEYSIFDEGTSFVTAEKGITALYREPRYLTTPLPVTTSYTYGNNKLAKPDSSSKGGSETSVFDNLSIAPTLVVTPTSPSSYLVKVNSGLNTIDFSTSINANEWCKLALHYSSYTTSISTSGFKIKFSDGSKLFVKDAIDKGYLTKLTLFTGFYPYSDPNWINFYTNGNLASRNYPANLIITKPLLYSITGVEFISNKTAYWGPYYDGFYAQKYDSSVQFSLSPIDKPDLQITDISWTPANPITGDDVSFTATVRNNGTKATADTVHNVDFFIDGTKVIWSDNYISSISPGESVTITANSGINGATWTATEGPHGVTAIVNSNQIIDEADTSNNSFVKIINQEYSIFDEGTSFVTAEKGIIALYREPGYLATQLPLTTSYTYGNNKLAKPDSSSQGGNETSVFDDLSVTPIPVVTPTSPSSYLVKVNSGLNTIDFSTSINANEWCKLALHYSTYTTSISTKDFKIKFSDGSKLFVNDAIDKGYLTKLTLFTGFYPYSDPNWINFYTNGNLASRNYPANLIITKPLVHSITGVEFISNIGACWGPHYYDGFYAQKYDSSVQFSLNPIVWRPKMGMPTGRAGHASSHLDNKIYTAGGYSLMDGTLKTVEEYDALTDTWASKADMLTARWGFGMAAVNGKILAAGGVNGTGEVNGSVRSGCLSSVEEYDPIMDMWAARSNMLTPRAKFGMVEVNGKIYAIGGVSENGYLKSVEEYDPATDIWIAKGELSVGRADFAVTTANGMIYIIGGRNSDNSYLDTVEKYDPVNGVSTETQGVMPTPRTGCKAAVLDGIIYVVGGWNGDYLRIVEKYDPVNDTWTGGPHMIIPRMEFSAEVFGGMIYVIGGKNYLINYLDSVERYEGGQM